MLNIKTAVRQMRVARRLGKISNEVQTRIMRRLAPRESQVHWENMMALRASIAREIAPAIHAKRVAERECFDIKYTVGAEARKAKLAPVTMRVSTPVLNGYEYTREWWNACEKQEREAKKLARREFKTASPERKRELNTEWNFTPAIA